MEPKGKGEAWSTGAERGRVGGRRKFISRTGMQTGPSKAVGPESRRGGEGTSSGGGEVTRQRVEGGRGRNVGCLTQREGEDDLMGPGPISPSCNDRCALPLELENHTHLGLFSDKFFAT